MTWITTIPYAAATGRLKKLYDRVKGPDDKIDNILMSHSLRPHTLEGHMALYKYVLHHTGNKLDKWFLEAVGTYVSYLNKCHYCVDHHYEGMRRLLKDDPRAVDIRQAFEARDPARAFPAHQAALLQYAEKLTCMPHEISEDDIAKLRAVGYDDGEILEVNQVTAYFNYANRTVLGLGVSTKGDILGLSPNNTDNSDDWSHS
ncbi:peroxidase-related enzyme [Paremcibacter congregatus]|uniref:carboxymuconolactone decarboxylase family protein n=1 Tax=Paremcibacter congregatus TaxID=2043170 RepID=UPI0030EB90A8|tara:strand:- start:702 stop:1307 length:606 start_codon:yes stop_codon:yes gene_type:complete